VAGDWIRAYAIFQDLLKETPKDPDLEKFMGLTVKHLAEVAFFADEMDRQVSRPLSGPVFSLPARRLLPGPALPAAGGRIILRAASLSAFPDYAYLTGLELGSFDEAGRLQFGVKAPYVKLSPKALAGRERTVMVLRMLNREKPEVRWDPAWTGLLEEGPGQLVLDLSYSQFLLLARAGDPGRLFPQELWTMAGGFGDCGYVPEVFQGEILKRGMEPLLLLPLLVAALILGWRLRAAGGPSFLGIPLLLVLPLFFTGLFHYCRQFFTLIGLRLLLSLGFTAALAAAGGILAAVFLALLMVLAVQRE